MTTGDKWILREFSGFEPLDFAKNPEQILSELYGAQQVPYGSSEKKIASAAIF